MSLSRSCPLLGFSYITIVIGRKQPGTETLRGVGPYRIRAEERGESGSLRARLVRRWLGAGAEMEPAVNRVHGGTLGHGHLDGLPLALAKIREGQLRTPRRGGDPV